MDETIYGNYKCYNLDCPIVKTNHMNQIRRLVDIQQSIERSGEFQSDALNNVIEGEHK